MCYCVRKDLNASFMRMRSIVRKDSKSEVNIWLFNISRRPTPNLSLAQEN